MTQLQALRARLVLNIHKIVLNLYHIPVPVIQDILKFRIGTVEGKTLVADLSLTLHIGEKFRRADGFEFLPLVFVHQKNFV